MFTNTINGMDRIFKTNNYKNLVIIVSGYAGTLKSTFIYSLMSAHLNNNEGQIGMYATLEQSKESLIGNCRNMGIKLSESVHIADYNRTREMFKGEAESADFLELTERLITSTKEEHGDNFTVFALDSANSLYALMNKEDTAALRKRMYYFFKMLRENNLTAFIIKENPRPGALILHETVDEGFLADGMIELGVRKTPEGKKRYVEVLKMRQNEHSMRQFVMDISPKGISIIGPSVDDPMG